MLAYVRSNPIGFSNIGFGAVFLIILIPIAFMILIATYALSIIAGVYLLRGKSSGVDIATAAILFIAVSLPLTTTFFLTSYAEIADWSGGFEANVSRVVTYTEVGSTFAMLPVLYLGWKRAPWRK
jgi:hypothetical protein